MIVSSSQNSGSWLPVLASFVGAFLAFLFGLVLFQLTRRYEEWSNHRKSLLSIQGALNQYLGIISENRVILRDMLDSISTPIDAGRTRIYWNTISLLPVKPDLLYEIKNEGLANSYLSLIETLRKFNGDAEMLNAGYGSLRGYKLSNALIQSHFASLVGDFVPGVTSLTQALPLIEEKIERVLAEDRVLVNQDKPVPIWKHINRRRSVNATKEDVTVQLEKMKNEQQQVIERSKTEFTNRLK